MRRRPAMWSGEVGRGSVRSRPLGESYIYLYNCGLKSDHSLFGIKTSARLKTICSDTASHSKCKGPHQEMRPSLFLGPREGIRSPCRPCPASQALPPTSAPASRQPSPRSGSVKAKFLILEIVVDRLRAMRKISIIQRKRNANSPLGQNNQVYFDNAVSTLISAPSRESSFLFPLQRHR